MLPAHLPSITADGQTDRQTDRQTDTHTLMLHIVYICDSS